MNRLVLVLVLVALVLGGACSKRSHISGAAYEAELPSGWHAGDHPLATALRAQLGSAGPAHLETNIQAFVDDREGAIVIAEFMQKDEPRTELPAPQANLMSKLAVHEATPELTDEVCRRAARRFFGRDGRKVQRGGQGACETVGADGRTQLTMMWASHALVVVGCIPGDPARGAACEQLLRSIEVRSRDP